MEASSGEGWVKHMSKIWGEGDGSPRGVKDSGDVDIPEEVLKKLPPAKPPVNPRSLPINWNSLEQTHNGAFKENGTDTPGRPPA